MESVREELEWDRQIDRWIEGGRLWREGERMSESGTERKGMGEEGDGKNDRKIEWKTDMTWKKEERNMEGKKEENWYWSNLKIHV